MTSLSIMAMFTHDGRQLITSAEDNEIRVWNLYSDHQSLLRRVCESLPRDISSEQAIRFLGRRADGEKDDGLLGAGQRPKRCAVLLNAAGK